MGKYAFYGTAPNLNYAVNRLNQVVFSQSSGSGSQADSEAVERAVQWALQTAADDTHGYDQANRLGPDYDCSSFVCSAFKNAGFAIAASNTTHSMRVAFSELGFEWIAYGDGWNGGANDLQRGDILLDIDAHTELYIGNQQTVGAHYNEFKGITGGQTGDQTGDEISVWDYVYKNFDGYLRYKSPTNEETTADGEKIVTAARTTPAAGMALCAGWVTKVFQAAGVGVVPWGNANDMYATYCNLNERSQLQPGMIIACGSSTSSPVYGHVGIYLGNDEVISDGVLVNGVYQGLYTQSVDSFISDNSGGTGCKWGWVR